jgi:hypothetical protein
VDAPDCEVRWECDYFISGENEAIIDGFAVSCHNSAFHFQFALPCWLPYLYYFLVFSLAILDIAAAS